MSKATQIMPATRATARAQNTNKTKQEESSLSILQYRHDSPINKVCWNHDSSKLAVGGHDRCVTIYNTRSLSIQKPVLHIFKHDFVVLDLAWSKDSTLLAVCGGGGKGKHVVNEDKTNTFVVVYDMTKYAIYQQFECAAWITTISFSHNSKFFAAAGFDKTLTIYSVAERRIIKEYSFQSTIKTLGWSKDDKYISCGGADCCVTIIKTNKLV